jgi:hypothetical protein
MLPLWQLTQPVVTRLWSKVAPDHVRVVWHISQSFELGMCRGGFPVAVLPLWQLPQPVVIPVWSKRAPAQVRVV